MRSVVVVLPASICAMIPMLRTFSRALVATVASSSSHSSNGWVRRTLEQLKPWEGSTLTAPNRGAIFPPGAAAHLPAVVSKSLVRLGHLVRVLAPLDGGAEAVGGIQQLVHQPLGHGLLATGLRVADHPAQRQRGGAVRLDLDRHLVGGATDASALDLECGLDVVQRALEGDDRIAARLVAAAFEGAVDDGLRNRALA